MRVAFFVHPGRSEAYEIAHRATSWLSQRQHVGIIPQQGVESWAEIRHLFANVLHDGVDLAVSLGGDGTMLRTVELSLDASVPVPVLGVNMGTLGYLTEVSSSELEVALEKYLNGDYEIEERMTLEVDVERSAPGANGDAVHRDAMSAEDSENAVDPEAEAVRGGPAGLSHLPSLVLNEAVVEKTFPGRTVRMDVSISGTPFLTYAADGLIVATPTGSTAYNLSVRGPIVSPRVSAVIVTPVSPHMLFDRSLVLEPGEEILIKLVDGRSAELVLDGFPALELMPGDCVSCRSGSRPARLVAFRQRDFHAILKAKFALSKEQ